MIRLVISFNTQMLSKRPVEKLCVVTRNTIVNGNIYKKTKIYEKLTGKKVNKN